MSVETLQEHLKSLEEDCDNISREGDATMQNLKEERQELNLKAHHTCTAIELNKLETKRLKCNMETVWKERKELKSKVAELENNMA